MKLETHPSYDVNWDDSREEYGVAEIDQHLSSMNTVRDHPQKNLSPLIACPLYDAVCRVSELFERLVCVRYARNCRLVPKASPVLCSGHAL